MRRLLPLLPMVLWGCPDDQGFPAKQCGVVGGQEESGFEAVGLVETPHGWCTGTLIAPRVVITAQHCFEPDQSPEDVGFRTGRFGEVLESRAVAVDFLGTFEQMHDAEGNPFWWIDTEEDFAVVVLEDDPSVAPMPYRAGGLARGDEGSRVDIVGYGTTGLHNNDAGIKRSGHAMLSSVGSDILETERQNGDASGCYGDSGGPLILDGEVVGVFSYFVDLVAVCEAGGQYVRVDRFQQLIDWGIETAGGDPGGGDDAPNDTCEWANDGVCDEGTYCYPGTDTADCAADPRGDDGNDGNAGNDACDPGFCVGGDDFCDEDMACCVSDSDCAGGDEGADPRGGDDGGRDPLGDGGKTPPIPDGCFPGVCESGDGYCDEDRPCCEHDPDCAIDC